VRVHWQAVVGFGAYFAALLSCALVPERFVFMYGTIWAGLVLALTAVFLVGYLRLSKPARDPHTGRRQWFVGAWAWLLGLMLMIGLVFGYVFTFRMLSDIAPPFTPEKAQQYRIGAAVFATVFAEQLWITTLWVRQQYRSRRRNRAAR
jgi:hypothetical protein